MGIAGNSWSYSMHSVSFSTLLKTQLIEPIHLNYMLLGGSHLSSICLQSSLLYVFRTFRVHKRKISLIVVCFAVVDGNSITLLAFHSESLDIFGTLGHIVTLTTAFLCFYTPKRNTHSHLIVLPVDFEFSDKPALNFILLQHVVCLKTF